MKRRWMKRWVVIGMVAPLVFGVVAHAADEGLEFGVQDDLSVMGVEGWLQDADLEVKGFSVFGSATGLNVPAAFTNGAGSVVISSNLFVNGQLKAGAIDLGGANMTVSNLTVQGFLHAQGDSLEVLKDASMSKSLTIGEQLNVTGNGTISGGLNVTGNGIVGGTLGVTGNTALGGTLGVTGVATLNNALNVGGITTLSTNLIINSTTPSADKATGAVVVQGGVGVGQNVNVGGALGVVGNTTLGGTLGVTGNGTFGGTLGVTGNTTLGGTLGVTGVATLSTNVTAVQSAFLATDGGAVGVGTATVDANTRMQVKGGANSGDYVAKFYSGDTMAAWIRKK